MEAAITFNVYNDYTPYLRYFKDGELDEEFGYKKAIKILNRDVSELVNTGQLVITYDGKPVRIKLPIEENDCGNIFGPEDQDYPEWNDVQIWCNVPCKKGNFNWDKLIAKEYPDWFEPKLRLMR